MNAPVLEIAALVKNYHGLRPLRLQQLILRAGEQLTMLGFDAPAAEMMTTLITGAALPDAGEISVLGRSTAAIANSDEWLGLVDRIGIVTDRAALLDSLSVIQNLSMPFTLAIEPPSPDVRARAVRLASESGLPEATWDRPVTALDGELRTRVHIARAVSLDPALLILEHPTARVARDAVRRVGRDVKSLAASRRVALLTLTADEAFADAVGATSVTWDPGTGRLLERRRPWRLWGRS